MKKTKLLLLIATLLAVATIFCSCGTVSSVNKFLNKDYDPLEDVYTTQSTISDLGGYSLIKDNENFAIFRSSDLLNPTYKVYSFAADKVIATFSNQTSIFEFELLDNTPIFVVAKATKPADTQPEGTPAVADVSDDMMDDIVGDITGDNSEDIFDDIQNAIDELTDVTYTAYDAAGNVIKTTSYKPEDPHLVNYDTCIFDYAIYSIGTDGVLTKTADIPEYVVLNDNIDHINEDYYYVIDDMTITVYDHSFNVVSYWCAPSYANNDNVYVMNNGNILVQYTYEVDEDQKKYDLSVSNDGYTAKLELVSLIVNAKNGSAKEIDLDYIVYECYTSSLLNNYYNYFEKESPFTDKFENIAIIAPIVDKKINDSEASLDIVFMNNKGKALDSLKIVDNQEADLGSISKIADDLYIADTLTGKALINSRGKVLQNMNSSLRVCGSYFIGDRAIYDLNLEIVYNLVENEAEVLDCIGNTVFVKDKNDNGYSIISFTNGEQKTIYTYTKDATSTTSFKLIDEIGYSIVDSSTGDYKYYNAEGTLIVTTTYSLSVILSSYRYDTVIMSGISGGVNVYHKISIGE